MAFSGCRVSQSSRKRPSRTIPAGLNRDFPPRLFPGATSTGNAETRFDVSRSPADVSTQSFSFSFFWAASASPSGHLHQAHATETKHIARSHRRSLRAVAAAPLFLPVCGVTSLPSTVTQTHTRTPTKCPQLKHTPVEDISFGSVACSYNSHL